MSQDPVRATTSRFLSPRAFLCYKLLATVYFVFWSFFWPIEENVDDAHEFVTYWVWYMANICEFNWYIAYLCRTGPVSCGAVEVPAQLLVQLMCTFFGQVSGRGAERVEDALS